MASSRVRPQLKIIFQHASLFALAALVVASGPVSGQTSGRQAREAEGAAEEAAPLRGPARGPDAREPADLPVGPAEPVPPPGRRIEYPVRPAASAIDVDGRLDEPGWLAAEPIPLPWETAPGDNAPAPVRTECYVTFDEERLYLGCVAREPDPDRIRAYITDRDNTEGHDRIVFVLDPFDDARRAFEFGVSALGVQSDAVYEEQSGESDASWDAIWRSAGRIAPEGWLVEAAIPFRSLRFPAGHGRAWGFHVRREWPRSDRVETRSMHWDRDRACQLCQANRVTGISGVSPGLDVELVPTLTARVAEARRDFPGGELEGPGPEPEVGLDARWGVTTDLTLNATLNPDFSQVEADAPQLDANTRFALFFPEKRPFFLEGADLFRTPVEAVFTRTVVDPVVGMKATGKLGASAVGAMVALDETNVLLLPGNQGSESVSLDQRVLSAVGRFRRDVGASGTVGALYTARVADGYGNHVGGLDAFLRPLPALDVRAQVLASRTEYPAEVAGRAGTDGAFGGMAAAVHARWGERSWYARLDLRARDPGFRADAGFVPQVDLVALDVNAGASLWGGPDDVFTRLGVDGGFWHYGSWAGRLTTEGVWANLEYGGPWQSRLWLNPNVQRQWFEGETHGLAQLWAGLSLRPRGSLSLEVSGMAGGGIDFANAREADELRLSPSVALRVGRHLDLRGSLSWQRLSVDGAEVLSAAVSELRAVYNLDTRTFLRATVQLGNTDRNPALYRDPVSPERTTLATQLLFSYKVNPLTVLFLGYSDDRLALTRPDRTEVPLTQRGRSLFLKLGYAWRP